MSSVKDYYCGRSIFVTGGTGFLGKVLIEKLLRSCSEIETIYLLVRDQKGKPAKRRVEEFAELELFDQLQESRPNVIERKLKIVEGNMIELGLGLSKEDKKKLTDSVSIIFHCAASDSSEDTLKSALLTNTRGIRETITLASAMKKLDAFIYVSTVYTNRKVIGEQMYPSLADWKKAITIAEIMDEYKLEIFSAKYRGRCPNNVTFSKSLAENVVNDMCKDKIAAVIYRPTIIMSSRNDPLAGWIDDSNDALRLIIDIAKGLLRSVYAEPNTRINCIPVDTVVRGLILAARQKGTTEALKQNVTIYNCAIHGEQSLTIQDILDNGMHVIRSAPLNKILWKPTMHVTNSKWWHYIVVISLQIVPSIIIDQVLKMTGGGKPMFVKTQRRIYNANMSLRHILTNEVSCRNDNFTNLERTVGPDETEEFKLSLDSVDVNQHFRMGFLRARRDMLEEGNSIVNMLIYVRQIFFVLYGGMGLMN